MKRLFLFAAVSLALSASAQIPYKVIVPTPDMENGEMVYMYNYDTRQVVDSAKVSDQKALFTGDVDEPYMVTVASAEKAYGTLVLEQGTSTINQATKHGVGTMLNDQLKQLIDTLISIEQEMQRVDTEEAYAALIDKYVAIERQAIDDNTDNPIGYYIFLDLDSYIDPESQQQILLAHPELTDYQRVAKIQKNLESKIATQPGKPFRDFEVTYDGRTYRLSDYVGKGDYVLVDFWASWCGPCMREIATLKDLYNQYSSKGLKFLGVAVWDEPEASKQAIERKQIPWECILDAQTVPTDAYGIRGIPCIILFGPDGTILSRDLQGEALKAAVASHLNAE